MHVSTIGLTLKYTGRKKYDKNNFCHMVFIVEFRSLYTIEKNYDKIFMKTFNEA